MVPQPTLNAPAGPSASVLAADVPCDRCGYNLRSLEEAGRCPECGLAVAVSMASERLRQARAGSPDPAWARQVREGAWLSVAAFVLLPSSAIAPEAWHDLPHRNAPLSATPGRIIFLSLACVAWVLAWASAWRLTAEERLSGFHTRRGLVASAARWLATAYLMLPFLWAWATWPYHSGRQWMPPGLVLPALLLLLCGWVGSFFLLLRLAQLFRRQKWRVSRVEAWLLAPAVPALALWASDAMDNGPSSLTAMWDLPVYPFGAVVAHHAIGDSFEYDYTSMLVLEWDQFLVWPYLVVPVWALSLFLRLLLAYRALASPRP